MPQVVVVVVVMPLACMQMQEITGCRTRGPEIQDWCVFSESEWNGSRSSEWSCPRKMVPWQPAMTDDVAHGGPISSSH